MTLHSAAGEAPGRYDVFISYARADDESFVARLRADLEAAGIRVWWDRKAMESRGLTFLQELRDAIVGIDRLVLVVGRKAVASDYVCAEWAFALDRCKLVIPILRLAGESDIPRAVRDQDYRCVPPELALLHVPDFRDDARYAYALEELVRILKVPAPPLATLHGVDPLPPHFQARPKLVDALRDAVLADTVRPTVVTSARQTVSLHGMGGVGKSVLAAAFVHSCGVRRAFGDGIHWLRFGKRGTGNVDPAMTNLRRLAASLGDAAPETADDTDLRHRIAERLGNRRCLVVLDDVWESDTAAAFAGLAESRSRLLITTRDASIAVDLGAQQCAVDVLEPEAAMTLLAEWSGIEHTELPREATQLVAECGGLPLALAMVGALLSGRPRSRWRDILDQLRGADLGAIRRQFPHYPYPDLLRALAVSVKALRPADRKRYVELAVFPDDASIPEVALEVLWGASGLSAAAVGSLVDRLIDRSLAMRDGADAIRLHDLQHDYVSSLASDRAGLHRRLLDAYRARCSDGTWPTGPKDGYFHARLIYHLRDAEGCTAVHELLASESDRTNRWFDAMEAAGLREAYVSALEQARDCAAQESARQIAESIPCTGVALEIGYALMNSSLSSLAALLPTKLIGPIAARGLLSPSELLSRVRSMPMATAPQAYNKCEAFASLARTVTPSALEETIRGGLEVVSARLADASNDPGHTGRLLVMLLDVMPPALIDVARELAERLRPQLHDEMLEVVLARCMMRSDRMDDAFEVVARITSPYWRGRALRMVAEFVPVEAIERWHQLRAGLTAQNGLDESAVGAVRLLAANGHIDASLEVIDAIADDSALRDALENLAPHLGAAQAEHALNRLQSKLSAARPVQGAEGVMALIDRLSEPTRSARYQLLLRELQYSPRRESDEAAVKVIMRLPETVFARHLARSEISFDEEEAPATWGRLAALGRGGEALERCRDLLQLLSGQQQGEAIAAIAQHLELSQLPAAMALARGLPDDNLVEQALSALLRRQAELGEARIALDGALRLRRPYWRDQTVEAIAPALDAVGLRTAVRAYADIVDGLSAYHAKLLLGACVPSFYRSVLLSALADDSHPIGFVERLAQTADAEFLAEALEAVPSRPATRQQVRERLALAATHGTSSLAEGIAAAVPPDIIMDASPKAMSDRLFLSAAVAPHLATVLSALDSATRSSLETVAVETFDWATEYDQLNLVAAAVLLLAQLRDPAAVRMHIEQKLPDGPMRVGALGVLACWLPDAEASNLMIALGVWISNRAHSVHIPAIELGDAMPFLPVDLLESLADSLAHADGAIAPETAKLVEALAAAGKTQRALELARSIPVDRGNARYRALSAIARVMHPREPDGILHEAFDCALHLVNSSAGEQRKMDRANALAALSPLLATIERCRLHPMLQHAFHVLAASTREEFLADLAALGPAIAALGGYDAIAEVHEQIDRVERWWP